MPVVQLWEWVMADEFCRNRLGKQTFDIDGVHIIFTKHAMQRAQERGIDLVDRMKKLRGVPLSRYKRRGVIVQWNKWCKVMKVITVW